MKSVVLDELIAFGHENVRATHRTTLEVTTDEFLTKRGDCIIGIKASKAASFLSQRLKDFIKTDDSVFKVIIKVEDLRDEIICHGSSKLLLSDSKSIVLRKSSFIDSRTIGILCNKAAIDINRKIVEKLRNRNAVIKIKIVSF